MAKGAGLGRMIGALVQGTKDLLGAEPPPPDASGHSPAAPAAGPPAAEVRESANRYAPIRHAMDQTLTRFMADVHEHLEIAPDERWRLLYLQLGAHGHAAQALLAQFFAEFKAPATRRNFALDAVRRNCAHGVLADSLLALRSDGSAPAAGEPDPWNDQIAPAAAAQPITLSIVGEWVAAPAAASLPAAAAIDGTDVSARQLRLLVHDARGQRTLPVTRLPLLLGKASADTPHALDGRYLSRRHARLDLDTQGAIVLHNLSANGSLADGLALNAGASSPLRNGARLVLGRSAPHDTLGSADCPQLEVHWAADASLDSPTPAVPAATTPAAGAASDTPLWHPPAVGPLALLALQDAEGTRTCAVLHLPYTIGRDPQADCPIPKANDKVARAHLRIQAVGDDGARLIDLSRQAGRNRGGWGTAIDGVEQPAEFTLPWGATVTLASRDSARPVRLQLRKPGG